MVGQNYQERDKLAMSDVIQIMTTTDSRDEAARIARELVRSRIAACVQIIGPITSTYWWNDEIETAEEWLCLIKTAGERYSDVKSAIQEIHSYDVPEILAMPVTQAGESYRKWLDAQVTG